MHDIYLKTTRVIHNRNNFDFLSFHAASTNFDRGFQKCKPKNFQHYSVLKNRDCFQSQFEKA